MAWRDDLRPGSFRGVSFYWKQSDNTFGRSNVVHEYPLSEDPPESEDMGIAPERFQLTLFVIGDDYMVQRDELKIALMKSGRGILVHPRYGQLEVVVDGDIHLTESTDEGGMATFIVNFLTVAYDLQLFVVTDTQQAAQDQAAATQTTAAAQLEDDYDPGSTSLLDDALGAVSDAFNTVETIIGNLETLQDTIQAIVSLPQQIAARLEGDIARVESLADLQRLFPYNYTGGPASAAALANRAALAYHVQVSALIAGVVLASNTDFVSYDEAIAAQATLLDQLDTVQLTAGDDLFLALEDLRGALVADIGTRAANLARLTSFTPPSTMPALVIAYRLYGTVDLENSTADILARNGIEHPAFVTGLVPLEVLTDWVSA
jgi:prophage DNA circulation protein